MKKILIRWALFAAILTTGAHAQIPVRGSTGQFGSVVAGANGLGLAPWNNEGFTQGSWMSFNNAGGSNGETDFINYHPALTGGFKWYSTTSSLGGSIMSLDNLGNLTATSFIGPLTGNVTGNLSGNAVGGLGQFGSLVVACNGCGVAGAWTPGSFTSGFWLAKGNKGGSNVETDFINYSTTGTRGFSWYSTASGTLGSTLMNLDASGNLTANSFIGPSTGISGTLAQCPNGATGIDNSGNAICISATYQVLAINITSGICTTGSGPYQTCASTFFLSPDGTSTGAVTFSSAPSVACSSGIGQGTNAVLGGVYVSNISTTQFIVTLQNTGTSGGEGATSSAEIHCVAAHN